MSSRFHTSWTPGRPARPLTLGSLVPSLSLMRAAPLALAGAVLATGLAGLVGCGEPPVPLPPRERTGPTLQTAPTCAALIAEMKVHLMDEVRAHIVREARAVMGDTPNYVDVARYEPTPVTVGVGLKRPFHLSRLDDGDYAALDERAFYALTSRGVALLDPDTLAPLAFLGTEEPPLALLLDDDRLFVVASAGVTSTPEDPVIRDGMPSLITQTAVTVFDLAADRSDGTVVASWLLPGQYRSMHLAQGRLWVATSYRPTTPVESISNPFFVGVVGAMQDAIGRAEANVEAMADGALLPPLVSRLDESEQPLFPADCNTVWWAEDNTGTSILALVGFPLLGDAPPTSSGFLTGQLSEVDVEGDHVVLAEHAQDVWWYWKNPDEPTATNLHLLLASTTPWTAVRSERLPGGLVEGALRTTTSGAVVATATNAYGVLDDTAGYVDELGWREAEMKQSILGERADPVQAVVTGQPWAGPPVVSVALPVARRGALQLFVGDEHEAILSQRGTLAWRLDPYDKSVGPGPLPHGDEVYAGFFPGPGGSLLAVGVGGAMSVAGTSTAYARLRIMTGAPRQVDDTLELHPTVDGVPMLSSGIFNPRSLGPVAGQWAVPLSADGLQVSALDVPRSTEVSLVSAMGDGGSLSLAEAGRLDHNRFFPVDDWDAASPVWRSRDIHRVVDGPAGLYAVSDGAVTLHDAGTLAELAAQTLQDLGPPPASP